MIPRLSVCPALLDPSLLFFSILIKHVFLLLFSFFFASSLGKIPVGGGGGKGADSIFVHFPPTLNIPSSILEKHRLEPRAFLPLRAYVDQSVLMEVNE